MKRGGLGQHGSCPYRGSTSIVIARKLDASDEDREVDFRNGFYAGLVVVAIWGTWVALLWQPERQVRLHSVHLLERIQKKDWKAAVEFVDPGYQDRWENDRARLLQRLREVLSIMPNATIEATQPAFRTSGNRRYWTAKIQIKNAGDLADYVESRVNSLDEPFEFEWLRGAWPWNWTLVSVRNSALEIPQ